MCNECPSPKEGRGALADINDNKSSPTESLVKGLPSWPIVVRLPTDNQSKVEKVKNNPSMNPWPVHRVSTPIWPDLVVVPPSIDNQSKEEKVRNNLSTDPWPVQQTSWTLISETPDEPSQSQDMLDSEDGIWCCNKPRWSIMVGNAQSSKMTISWDLKARALPG